MTHLIWRVFFKENCVIPEIDPWDPTIQKYLNPTDPLKCKHLQYELTFLNADGRIQFNESEFLSAGYASSVALNCQYRCFDRKEGDDVTLDYGEWTKLIVRDYC